MMILSGKSLFTFWKACKHSANQERNLPLRKAVRSANLNLIHETLKNEDLTGNICAKICRQLFFVVMKTDGAVVSSLGLMSCGYHGSNTGSLPLTAVVHIESNDHQFLHEDTISIILFKGDF
jgi:hypothetical protein